MRIGTLCVMAILSFSSFVLADYKRNEAVAVQKVLFGHIISVRPITEFELIEDKRNGWKTFGGAVAGGVIGNQFGSGNGRAITTILGALIGGSLATDKRKKTIEKEIRLVELLIKDGNGDEYLVIQDRDPSMSFKVRDAIRMIYLKDGTVRIDKQL